MRVLWTAAALGVLVAFSDVASAAGITVTDAKVEGGKLVVTGRTPAASQNVTLDGSFTVRSNASRVFAFAISNYLPFDCVVDLKAGTATGVGVVANCGHGVTPRGAWTAAANYLLNDLVTRSGSTWRAKAANKGKPPASNPALWEKFASRGDEGVAGPRGAVGARGLPGPKGDKGDKGATGATGATGAQGPQGLAGPTGPQGPAGFPSMVQIHSGIGGTLAPNANFVFAGLTEKITLPTSRKIFASVTAPLSASSQVAIDYSVCWRQEGTSAVITLSCRGLECLSQSVHVDTVTKAFTAGAVIGFALTAGTYDVGFCIRNISANSVNYGEVFGFVGPSQ